MRLPAFLAALALGFLIASSAGAQEGDKIKAELKKKYPDVPIDAVRKTPYGGLYEISGGGEVFYTDEKVTYLLLGSIIDTKTRENVTETRAKKLSAVKFDSLPLDSAVKIVRGNGSRRIAMFADPNCGYCKRFERDLIGVTDITVYVFLYPILSPDSITKSKAVWCSADKGKAWLDIMLKDVTPTNEITCTTPIEKNLAYGKEKRITGTPTLFFEDGERIPGAMPLAAFEKRILEASAAQAAQK
jgi:thiol:disulfide interchange protein DsbC